VTTHERHRASDLGSQLHEDGDKDIDAGEDDGSTSVLDVEEMLLGDDDHRHSPSSSIQTIAHTTVKKTLHSQRPTRNQHVGGLPIQSLLN
jgi:hypothetical protein